MLPRFAAAVGAVSLVVVVVAVVVVDVTVTLASAAAPPPPLVSKHNFAGQSLRALLSHDETWRKEACVS